MTRTAGYNKHLFNFVTVLSPKNIQNLYQDSEAFPNEQGRTCQNFKT